MCYCIGFAFRNFKLNFDAPRKSGVFYEILRVLSCIGSFVKYFNRELLFDEKETFVV